MNATVFCLRTATLVIFCLLFSITVTASEPAEEPKEYSTAHSIMAFANNLYHQGQLFRAVMEYERFIYFHPAHPDVPKAEINIAHAMKLTGELRVALNQFSLLTERYPESDIGAEALFQKAELLSLMGEYHHAHAHYREFLSHYPLHPLSDKAMSAIDEIPRLRK